MNGCSISFRGPRKTGESWKSIVSGDQSYSHSSLTAAKPQREWPPHSPWCDSCSGLALVFCLESVREAESQPDPDLNMSDVSEQVFGLKEGSEQKSKPSECRLEGSAVQRAVYSVCPLI